MLLFFYRVPEQRIWNKLHGPEPLSAYGAGLLFSPEIFLNRLPLAAMPTYECNWITDPMYLRRYSARITECCPVPGIFFYLVGIMKETDIFWRDVIRYCLFCTDLLHLASLYLFLFFFIFLKVTSIKHYSLMIVLHFIILN